MELQRFKRNYKACLNCRLRKVKCDLGSVDNPRDGKCARCLRERKDCVFVESRRGGSAGRQGSIGQKSRTNSLTNVPSGGYSGGNNSDQEPGQYGEESAPNGPPEHNSNQAESSSHFSTMEGALVFLAQAAGTIAKADERDNIDGVTKHRQIEAGIEKQETGSGDTSAPESGTESVPLAASLSNILNNPTRPPGAPGMAELAMALSRPRLTVPAADGVYLARPQASRYLSNIEYIGPDGLLSEQEAEMLVNLFFTTIHPFFPHVPKFLHSPKTLSGYPILLCAILTIASRYYSLEPKQGSLDDKLQARNIELHDRLWLYVQRLISQTVWAEASTRSIGTIFAFLLFTEWNPRAIHWRWSDYANRADDPDQDTAANTNSDDVNLAGLGAMRRSYRMAWMLIGSAVRLAQDMGFMEVSAKTFLATHIAEINSVMNISRRSMLAHSLSEVDLDEEDAMEEEMDDEDEDYKILNMSEEDIKRLSAESSLKFTRNQKAKIELLQIMSLGHESLYGYKAQLGALSQRQNLAVLNIISPLLNGWVRKYREFLVPSNSKLLHNSTQGQSQFLNPNSKLSKEVAEAIDRESFIFEFHYARLYIYSLALSPSPKSEDDKKGKRKSRKVTLKLDELSKSAKYIEMAFTSANEMLSAAHRIHKLKLLRFMPVRWLTRIVRAVAFIVKCYLTITAHKSSSTTGAANPEFDSTILSLSMISVDEIMQSIQKAAITLRDCSPDELHLCTRYSTVLMYLCSEMKTKAKMFSAMEEDEFPAPKRRRPNMTFSDPSSRTNMFGHDPILQTNSDPVTPMGSSSQVNLPEAAEEAGTREESPYQNLAGDSGVMEWFMNNRDIGLDFVGPWTEMIEQQLATNEFNFDQALGGT